MLRRTKLDTLSPSAPTQAELAPISVSVPTKLSPATITFSAVGFVLQHSRSACLAQRLLPDGAKRRRRRDRVRIDLEVNDGGLSRFLRGFERGPEIRGLLHGGAETPEGTRIGSE